MMDENTQNNEHQEQQEQQGKPDNSGMQELQEQKDTTDQSQESADQASQQDGNSKEYNFEQLREEKKRREREAQQYRRKLEEYERQMQQQKQQQSQQNMSPDDIPTWGDVEKQLNQYKQQVENATAETKLKQEFPDFDKVVRQETITQLRDKHPELAQAVSNTQDMYAQGKSAYTLIKQLGLVEDEKQKQEKERVQNNASTPKPATNQSNSPLTQSDAFSQGLTPELKQQLWREMQEAKKRR